MKRLIVIALISLLSAYGSGCKKKIEAPPEAQNQIMVVVDGGRMDITKWIKHYTPRAINDYAGYRLAVMEGKAPYIVVVSVVDARSQFAGITKRGNAYYKNYIELRYLLIDPRGEVLWEWGGYDSDRSYKHSTKRLAKLMSNAMRKEGFLTPSYYTKLDTRHQNDALK